MARDYKHAGRKKAKRKPVSGPVWMVAGLSVGLLVALLVYLNGQPGGRLDHRRTVSIPTAAVHKSAHVAKTKVAAKKQPEKTTGNAQGADGVRYEFYTLLPQSEVVIPDDELAGHDKNPTKPAQPGSYMLQAGSFRHEPEAKKMKAELALIGIVAGIQNVTVGGDTWYRVRVGPYSTLEEINRVRRRLQTNHINAIAVRIKG